MSEDIGIWKRKWEKRTVQSCKHLVMNVRMENEQHAVRRGQIFQWSLVTLAFLQWYVTINIFFTYIIRTVLSTKCIHVNLQMNMFFMRTNDFILGISFTVSYLRKTSVGQFTSSKLPKQCGSRQVWIKLLIVLRILSPHAIGLDAFQSC